MTSKDSEVHRYIASEVKLKLENTDRLHKLASYQFQVIFLELYPQSTRIFSTDLGLFNKSLSSSLVS